MCAGSHLLAQGLPSARPCSSIDQDPRLLDGSGVIACGQGDESVRLADDSAFNHDVGLKRSGCVDLDSGLA